MSGDPAVRVVHADFDAQFNAPIQIELASARQVLKTTSLVDLKKVGERWIPRTFDVRNEVTRDKTRFTVTVAALGVEFTGSVFEPATLGDAIAPPPASARVQLEP